MMSQPGHHVTSSVHIRKLKPGSLVTMEDGITTIYNIAKRHHSTMSGVRDQKGGFGFEEFFELLVDSLNACLAVVQTVTTPRLV